MTSAPAPASRTPRSPLLLSIVVLVLLAFAPGVLGTPGAESRGRPDSGRGQLLWAQHRASYDVATTRATLRRDEFGAADVRYGVELYRLVYRTPAPSGRLTTASGLVALPRDGAGTLRTVSFAHGTVSERALAPSSLPDDLFASAPAIAYAAAGFAAVAPDYVGLGLGPDPHPWFDVPSETTASLDLLRAARTFVTRLHRRLAPDVYVTGFSQGASAALGLGRALQRGDDRRFRLAALAPVSGAYAFRDVDLPALLHGRVAPPNDVAYATYLLVAWNRLHHLYRRPADVFRAPYADRVDTLFNGNTPGADMIAALPRGLDRLLTPRGLALLAHPTARFAAALRAADSICHWTPRVPVRLYYARGDEQAVTDNTAACRQALRARGVDAPGIDLGTPSYADSRHLGSAVAGTAATLRWFLHLAQ